MAFKGSLLALLLVAICHVHAKSHHKSKKFQIPQAVTIGAVPAAAAPPYAYPNCPCYPAYQAQGAPCACASAVEDIEKKAKDEKKLLVVHLDFEKETKGHLEDKSNFGNDAQMSEGAILVNFPKGGCGNAVYTWDGDILFHGDTFQAKPHYGITICAYILLRKIGGRHEIFDTIGASHTCGQYHFEVNEGNVRWFHRDETQNTVFSAEALGGVVKSGQWAHVCGTFDGVTGKAKIYVNGELKNMTVNAAPKELSRDWAMRAGIGDHKVMRPLSGYMDEFMMYNHPLPTTEIKKLATKCTGYKPAPPTPPKKKPFFDADLTSDQQSDDGAINDMADTDLLDDSADTQNNNNLNDNLESEADDTAEPVTDMTQNDSKLDHSEETVEEAVLKRSQVNDD